MIKKWMPLFPVIALTLVSTKSSFLIFNFNFKLLSSFSDIFLKIFLFTPCGMMIIWFSSNPVLIRPFFDQIDGVIILRYWRFDKSDGLPLMMFNFVLRSDVICTKCFFDLVFARSKGYEILYITSNISSVFAFWIWFTIRLSSFEKPSAFLLLFQFLSGKLTSLNLKSIGNFDSSINWFWLIIE